MLLAKAVILRCFGISPFTDEAVAIDQTMSVLTVIVHRNPNFLFYVHLYLGSRNFILAVTEIWQCLLQKGT